MDNTSVFESKAIYQHGLMRSNSLPPELTGEFGQNNEDFNSYYPRTLEATDQNQNLGGSFDSKIRNKNGTDWTDFEWGNEHFSESQYSFTDIESDFEKFNSRVERKYKLQNDVKSETALGRKCEAKYNEACESLESSDCESDNGEGLFENYDMFLVKEKESSLDLLKNIWIKKTKHVPGSKTGQTTAIRPGSKTRQTKFDKPGTKTLQTAPDQSGSKTGQAAHDELGSQTGQAEYGQGAETWQTSSGRPRPTYGQNTSDKSENGSLKTAFDVMERADNQTITSFNTKLHSQNLGESDLSSEEEEETSNDESGQLKNDLFRNKYSESSEMSGQETRMEITVTWENNTGNSDEVSVVSETTEIISDQNPRHDKNVVKKLKLPTDEDDDFKDVNLFKKKASKVLPPRPPVDALPTEHSSIYTNESALKDGGRHGNRSNQLQDDAAIFDTKEASHHGISVDSKQNEPISNAPFSVTYGTFGDNQNEGMSNSPNLCGISDKGSHTYRNKEKEQFSFNGYDNLDGYEGQSSASEGHHIDHHDNTMYKEGTENSSSSLSSSSHTTVQGPEHVCHHQHHHCAGHHHHHQHRQHHHHHHQYQDGYQNGHQGHYSHYNGRYSRKQDQMMQITLLMEAVAESAGFVIHDVMPDGNCMYRSVVDQLRLHGEIEITALSLRQMAVKFLRDNPCHEDGTHLQEFLLAETWDNYLVRMNKDGEWGDQIMLRGIAEVTGRKICIFSAIGDTHNHITIEPSKAEADQSENIYLGHMDDAHYVSLRPKNWRDTWYANVRKKMENKKQKSEQSTIDQREVNLVGQTANKMLESQNQGNELLTFPSRDELIDTTSGLPYYHISFIIRHVLSENYFHVPYFDWESKLNNDQSNSQSKTYAVGSAVENLEFTISSSTPMRSSFAFLRRNCQSQNKIKGPTLYILWDSFKRVVFHGEKASHPNDVIAVTEEVHPGYLRLHPYIPNNDYNITWIRGHIPCLNNTGIFKTKNSNLSNLQAQMSNMESRENNEKDVMAVYWSDTWPEMAMNWVTRERPSGWPSHNVIQQVLVDGCFIVPVHHPMSLHPECEWRFSFAYSEKTLAFTISKSQRHCFQVFKALVDYFTGDNKLLSTYFLKTVFFHVCEAIAKLYWRSQPASCILYLLDKLLLCLRQKNLPHYFILENNIIDHFHDNDIRCLITRLEAVRKCPTIAVVLLAESHCLLSSTLADPILKDISQFLEHKNLYRSIIEVIVPTLFEKAQGYLNYMMFEAATETVKSAHTELTRSNQSQGEEQVVQLSSFAKEFINGLQMPQKFWFCFFLDYFYETHTTADLTRNQTGFKTLKEISGAEVHEGEFDHVRIPESILKQLGQNFGQSFDELCFMQDLCINLFNAELYEEAAYYIRCSVKKLKQKIENPLSDPHEHGTETKTESTGSKHSEESKEYQKHKVISIYVSMLGVSLISLFQCYSNTHQVELFQEYISDLEEFCEREPSAVNYQKLSVVWSYLGNREKAKEAIRKKELMQ